MYTYEINFKNGKMLAAVNVIIEEETITIVNYMREKTAYNKNGINSVIEKRFFMGKVQEKTLFENKETNNLPELDKKTLEACNKDLNQWKNRVFKTEIDTNNNLIKVISKRKATKGKYFTFPLYEELKNIQAELLEKYIYSKYTTQIYLYM